MNLLFTNKQIFFVLESIWSELDYKFKYHINTIVSVNSEEDYQQTVTVSVENLMKCYKAMSSGAYGCTTDMAEILLKSLRDQLLAKANIVDYMTYLSQLAAYKVAKKAWDEAIAADPNYSDPEPIEPTLVEANEEAQSLILISDYKKRDKSIEEAKILNGKTQILA